LDFGPVVEVFNGFGWETYSGQLLQLDANGRLLVRTTVTQDDIFEGAETFSLTAVKPNGQSAQGIATVVDDGTGDIYRLDGSLNMLAAKDDDRRSPPIVQLPPVDMPQPVEIALSPERWMPRTGEYELHLRWEHQRDQSADAHSPLRFDSALQPLLNLDSVKDLGLTEPVVNDPSQRLKSYDWLQVLPADTTLAVSSLDTPVLLQPKVLAGLTGLPLGGVQKWVFDVPRLARSTDSSVDPVMLRASLATGQALPDGLAFDAAEGRFEVLASERLGNEVLVHVHAQSSDGTMTSKSYELNMEALSEHAAPALPARQGLSEKLKLAAKNAVYVQSPVETVEQ
jgi:hypothetical protein